MEPDELRQLGRSRVSVPRLGIGTGPLGNLYEPVEEDQALAAVDRAWELGVRFFDTAPLYGYGIAERRLGTVLRSKPREELVLATKVGRLLREEAPPRRDLLIDGEQPLFAATPSDVNPVDDYTYDGAMRSVEESLARMGVDRVDILHIHEPGSHYEEALGGAWVALERLRAEGVVGAIGVGTDDIALLCRFAREADFDCFLLAGGYTLLDQSAAEELFPTCLERGISIIMGSVFGGGILVDEEPGGRFGYGERTERTRPQIRRLREICARHRVPLGAVAIQCSGSHPAVAAVLVGVRSREEIEQDVRWSRWPIPNALWEEVASSGVVRADDLPGRERLPGS